jgi:hypothetical protein
MYPYISSPVHLLPRLLLVLGLFWILSACSSTKITESWDNSEYSGPPAQKVLVVGMIKDAVTRRFFEQHFVAEAKKKGVDAIASYEFIPNPNDHDQREELIKLIKQTGANAVLVAQMKGIDKDEKYVPGRMDWFPDAYQGYGFYNYYYRSYRAIYRPGYIGSDKYLKMQMRYFDVNSEKLLWAGNTRTKNPKSLVHTIETIARKVVSDLKGNGLL